MKVFLIDDEMPSLEEFSYLLGKYPDLEISGAYTNSRQALEAVKAGCPDAVFLDIDMPGMNGLELALKIQDQCAGVIILFVTAHPQYALEAFKAYPLDYLLKPVKEARLDAAVEHMRRQHALLHPAGARENSLKIKCFGAFKMLAGREIKWPTRRVRELFLYLIDRGGLAATKNEILQALFQGQSDKSTTHNLYMTLYRLRNLLDTLDQEKKYLKMTGDYALHIAPGVCDYRDFMDFAGKNVAVTEKNAVEAARILNLCPRPYLEDENCDWAGESASQVESAYERIALGLAGCYAATGRRPEAEGVLNALLLRNPLAEDGHAMLLDLYMQSGNHQAFRARYEEYARVLKKELKLKPRQLYQTHYKNLTLQ